jgi:glycosyltransferase involved in cell wall biosynthesis
MKPICVDFDAQLLLEAQKTGIGRMAYQTLWAMSDLPKIHGTMNIFTMRKGKGYEAQWEEIGALVSRGLVLRRCAWFHDVLYKMLWNFLPIPYRLYFGSGADVTHFFNYYIPPGVAGKRVTTVCDMVFLAHPETMNAKTRMMLRLSLKKSVKRAHHIVTISEFSKSEILSYLDVPESKITVVPLGVDHDAFRPDIPDEEKRLVKDRYGLDEDYFLYLGTLEPRKNIVRLINAYARLCRMRRDVPLLCIAGRKGWQFDEIFAAANDLEIASRVVFTDYISQKDAPALIASALAFVFPSVYEGFGLPPLEAMACGTPVIAADIPSLREVVADAGVLVDPYDSDRLTRAMENIIDDAALRVHLRHRGIARAATFTWERTAHELLFVYEKLLQEG